MTTKAKTKRKKTMKLDEFFELLPKRGWYLAVEYYSNCQVLIRRRSGGVNVCPVCAVANRIAKRHKYCVEANDAAKALGMSLALARRIVCAADNRSAAERRLRSRLLKHCGLVENSINCVE